MVHADLALYSAKRQGGGGFSFFSEAAAAASSSIASSSSTTCGRQSPMTGFSVFFQPQVSLTDGAITGVEALARW